MFMQVNIYIYFFLNIYTGTNGSRADTEIHTCEVRKYSYILSVL
jgi:hypothetical protein